MYYRVRVTWERVILTIVVSAICSDLFPIVCVVLSLVTVYYRMALLYFSVNALIIIYKEIEV